MVKALERVTGISGSPEAATTRISTTLVSEWLLMSISLGPNDRHAQLILYVKRVASKHLQLQLPAS